MRASTEEFLYVMLWTADSLLSPSWRNVHSDFESWAWRNGLSRRLAQLEKRKLLEQHPASTPSERIVRLTAAGRLVALGGRDPMECWARAWDGRWRLVLFDLPSHDAAVRSQLHRLLRDAHFGYLQHSVWITPDRADEVRKTVHGCPVDPESFIVFEGRPATGEPDSAIVQGAWDFVEINRRYERHLAILRAAPRNVPAGAAGPERLRAWAAREYAAWKHATDLDPLLPLALLPSDYAGRTAWTERCAMLAQLARERRSVAPAS